MPCPGYSTTSSATATGPDAASSERASGWRLPAASDAAIRNANWSKSGPFTSAIVGSVSVPVLSNTTVSTSASRSSAVGDFSNTPARNSRPVAITCTTGTANANAQGQVMISTAHAVSNASLAGTPAAKYHHRKVDSAVTCTAGA